MSNRQARKHRRVFIDGDRGTAVTGLGTKVKVEGDQLDRLFSGARLDAIPEGEHVWTLSAVWLVDPTSPEFTRTSTHLDTENMLMVAGPGCYRCEQYYTAELAAQPCKGSNDLMPPGTLAT